MNIRLVSKIVFVMALFSATLLLAQDSASVTGTVRDSSGASVANAQVTVSAPDRGINRETTTNGDGEYSVAALPPGSYNIVVTAQGFKKFQAKDVVLRVAQKARVDVPLQIGATTTEVTVLGADVAQVETQSSELSGTVTGKQISQLTLNGRNFTQLVTLVPGVSNQTGQDEGTVGINGSVSYSMNGGRTEYNNWEIDGGDNMDNGSNTSLNVYPNLDAIAEFKVLTSNYGAQYGRSGSGTVEVETKPGTSQFHGTASYFGRNEAFNARNFFDTEKPSYKKHDFGYTIGGPVILPGFNKERDKTFFFWSQEWRRERNPATFLLNVPSDAERSGDFTDLCPGTHDGADCPIDPRTGEPFDGSLGPLPIDPNAVFLLPMIPNANSVDSNGFAQFQQSVSTPTTWREELIRVDHNITPNMRATFRYIHDSWKTVVPQPLWTNGDSFPTIQTDFSGPALSLVARLTATVSPTLLNEFVFSYTTDHIVLKDIGAWQRDPSMTVGLFQNGFGGRLPGIQIASGNTAYGDGFAEDPGYLPNGPYNSNPTYTFRDNVSKTYGKHNLQFGAYLVFAQKNELDGSNPSIGGFAIFDNTSAFTTGNAFADLLTGKIASFQQQNQQVKYYNRYKIVEPYFQDDWHISNRLTLNLGLRISMFGTYRERYKQAFNFEAPAYTPGNSSVDPETGLVVGDPFNGMIQCGGSGVPPGCMKGHLFNPAPRIGFAYDVFGDGKMAVRGGYGIFYEHTNGNEGNTESLFGTPPLVLNPTQSNIDGYDNVGGVEGLFPLNVRSIPTSAIWPYMQQWHVDIQRDLPSHIVVTGSYVGSKGTHLTLQRNLNQLHPTALADNPYAPGEAIGPNDCGGSFDEFGVPTDAHTPSGVPITGQAAVNLAVAACGANADLLRTEFPGFSGITRLEPQANSSYHAFQLAARRTIGALNLSLAYTYSHSIDNSSSRSDGTFVDSFDLARTRANSNFDQRHILTISYVYDLPFFKGGGLSHAVLGGWQFSGITSIQSGTPFTVENGTDFSDAAGVANGLNNAGSYADIVGDPRSGFEKHVPGDTGPRLYNPDAYVAPQGLTFGNSGRNSLTLPRRTNFDFSLFKHFSLGEARAFEFRWDNFNAFNHTQFSAIDQSLGSSTFLEATSAHAARIMQFGAKFIF